MTSPSRLAEWLLALVVRDPEWRDGVIGDLREEHARLVGRIGARRARRWHARHSVGIAIRYGAQRLLRRPTPPRRWLAAAAQEPTVSWTAGLYRDLPYAWRAIAHRPALSATIAVTLAIALAANATIFNFADAIYLRPFRFPHVDRLVLVMSAPEHDLLADKSNVAPADLRDWTREATKLTDFSSGDFWEPNLSEVEEPEQLHGFRVSPNFFRTLRVQPAIGRDFVNEEGTPGNHRRVVLSHTLWLRRFGGDRRVVGQSIRLDGEPHEVIGVMPPGIALPYAAQLWAPLALTEDQWTTRNRGWLLVVARLSDGATLAQASSEMRAIVARQRQAFPDTNGKRELGVLSFTRGLGDGAAGSFLAMWQAAALLLFLIACANIANLLLARGTERQQEFSVRLALGASRRRLAVQVMIEGALLACGAFALALPLAAAGVDASRRGLPARIVRWVPGYEFLELDFSVLAVMAVLGAFAVVFFSLLPALQASRAMIAGALRQGGRALTAGPSRQWTRTFLASAQVALTVALVGASGMILGAVDGAVNQSLGFDKRHVMTATLTLPAATYADAERRRQFIDAVLARLKAIPAIESAAVISEIPYGEGGATRPIQPEGVEVARTELMAADYRRMTPEYLTAVRVPLLEGRLLTDADRQDTRPVAVVSRAFADRYWPGREAGGRRFRTAPDAPWIEVVGVVGDVRHHWLGNRRRAAFYRPIAQDVPFTMSVVSRTVGNPSEVAGEFRRAVAAADRSQPLLDLRPLEEVVADSAGGIAHLARVLAVMSGIALVLALLGVYSLAAFLAARRTQEIGVRMALGATTWDVIRLTAKQSAVITALGLVAGAAMAFGAARLMESMLFGLVSLEVLPLAALVLILGVVSMAAGFLPARRAAALDPTVALRSD